MASPMPDSTLEPKAASSDPDCYQQYRAFLQARADGERQADQMRPVATITTALQQAANALNAGVMPPHPDEIWAAISNLEQAMSRAGYARSAATVATFNQHNQG